MRLHAAKAIVDRTGAEIGPVCLDIHGAFIASVTHDAAAHDADVVLSDRYLVAPAFINTHTHLALSALRGVGGLASLAGNVVEELYFRVEQHLTEDDVRAFTRIGAYESLLCGTGMVWDHYYFAHVVAEVLDEVGLCGAVAPALQDLSGPGAPNLDHHLADIDRITAMKVPGIAPVIGPHATDTVSDALWTEIRDRAAETGLPVHAHLAQSADEVRRSWARHGCGPLERLRRLGVLSAGPAVVFAHGLHLTQAELQPLSGERAVLAYCPAAQALFDFPAPVKDWQAAGGTVALGTDAGSCNDTVDIQAELRIAALGPSFAMTDSPERRRFASNGDEPALAAMVAHRQAAHQQQCPPADLLAMVWSVPGSLHPQLPAGRLAPGNLANLAIYDTWHPSMWPGIDLPHALVYSHCSSALHGMMLRGRWVGERGAYHASLLEGDGYHTAVQDAHRRLHALLQRAGVT